MLSSKRTPSRQCATASVLQFRCGAKLCLDYTKLYCIVYIVVNL
jgi:hypothetical protein